MIAKEYLWNSHSPLYENERSPLKPAPIQKELDSTVEEKKSNFDKDVNLILFPPRSQAHCSRPIIIISLKVIGILASYAASYPFIKPAESVTDNPILKKFFSAGEFVAWGTLTAWSACKLIDRISKTSDNQKKSCHPAAYWVPLYFLGILSEIPSAYISYQYNKDIFWTIYTPLLYSLFGTQSMDLLVQKIAHSNNPLTRFLYRKTIKPEVLKAKDKFSNVLQKFLSEETSFKNSSLQNKLLEIAGSQDISKNDVSAYALLSILKSGLEIKMKKVASQPVCVKFGNRSVQVLGSAASLTMSSVDGFLVYKGSELLIESKVLTALIIFMAVVPSAYLSLEINRKNFSSIFFSIVNLKNSSVTQLPNRVGNVASIVMTCFGLGSLFTILKDTIGFQNWSGFLISATVLLASAILTINALNDFFDFSINKIRFLKMNTDEKKLIEFNRRLQSLVDYFKKAPVEAFQDLLTGLNINALGASEFNNFFEKLKTTAEGQTLTQDIENKLKSIEEKATNIAQQRPAAEEDSFM